MKSDVRCENKRRFRDNIKAWSLSSKNNGVAIFWKKERFWKDQHRSRLLKGQY
jgi:hypothetical protein